MAEFTEQTDWNAFNCVPRHRGCDRLRKDSDGNAVAEYAILVAMIVGVALLGSRLLGPAASRTFSTVFASADASKAVPPSHRSTTEPVSGDGASVAEAETGGGWFSLRLLLAELVAVVALGGLWYLMHAARKQRKVADDDEVPPSVSRAIPHNRLYQKRQQIYRILSGDMQALFASRIQVRHVMSPQVTRVGLKTPVEEVRQKMNSKRFRHLLVCRDDGTVLGIISDRDLAEREGATAGDLMTADPLTVSPEAQLNPAVTAMIENRISCLPVKDDGGQLVGVLTSTDLMMTLQCALQLLHKVATEIGGTSTHAPSPDAAGSSTASSTSNREQEGYSTRCVMGSSE